MMMIDEHSPSSLEDDGGVVAGKDDDRRRRSEAAARSGKTSAKKREGEDDFHGQRMCDGGGSCPTKTHGNLTSRPVVSGPAKGDAGVRLSAKSGKEKASFAMEGCSTKTDGSGNGIAVVRGVGRCCPRRRWWLTECSGRRLLAAGETGMRREKRGGEERENGSDFWVWFY